jgi:hypothetical protein
VNEWFRTGVELAGLGLTVWQLQKSTERRTEKKQEERHTANLGRFDTLDRRLVDAATKINTLETQIAPLWKALMNKLDRL